MGRLSSRLLSLTQPGVYFMWEKDVGILAWARCRMLGSKGTYICLEKKRIMNIRYMCLQ